MSNVLFPILGKAADVGVGTGANSTRVVTYDAAEGQRHVITGIAWSYIGASAGTVLVPGTLTVADGAAVIFAVDITSMGTGIIVFPFAKSGTVNAAMVITLSAGGADVTGKMSVLNHYTQR